MRDKVTNYWKDVLVNNERVDIEKEQEDEKDKMKSCQKKS